MIHRLRFGICAAVLFLLQTSLVHRFTHGPLRPDLLCAAAVFLALEAEHRQALGGAFALGILRDLGSSGRLGGSALLFVLGAAGLLFLRDRLFRDSFLTDLALTFACVLGIGILHALAVAAVSAGADAGRLLSRALGQAVFTTAVSPLLFALLAKIEVVDRARTALADTP